MNILQFKAELANIENNLKYAYQFEEILRKYASRSTYISYSQKGKQELHYTLRILSTALKHYKLVSKKSLPDFIYKSISSLTKYTFKDLFETLEPAPYLTYDYYTMIFTDSKPFTTEPTYGTSLVNYSELVLDKPVPCNIDFNYSVQGFYNFIAEVPEFNYYAIGTRPHSINKIYHLEHILKHTKNPDKSKYPHIQALLDKAYKEYLIRNLDNEEAINEAIYKGHNIIDLSNTIHSKLKDYNATISDSTNNNQ